MTETKRQPALYITHGGGPCFWMEFPPPLGAHAFDSLKAYFAGLLDGLPQRPHAIVMVSAHWETAIPTVGTAARPGMIYDYYGFPAHTYDLQYPAPGSPELAARVLTLLREAGIEAAADPERGFDHGVFVPMKIIDPDNAIPVVTLSIRKDYDPAAHYAVGQALAGLRDENVLIIGSGSSFHNLRTYFHGDPASAKAFDDWMAATVAAPEEERRARLLDWAKAPGARGAHPQEDHLVPLFVAAGAAGVDTGRHVFHDLIGGNDQSCFAFG